MGIRSHPFCMQQSESESCVLSHPIGPNTSALWCQRLGMQWQQGDLWQRVQMCTLCFCLPVVLTAFAVSSCGLLTVET